MAVTKQTAGKSAGRNDPRKQLWSGYICTCTCIDRCDSNWQFHYEQTKHIKNKSPQTKTKKWHKRWMLTKTHWIWALRTKHVNRTLPTRCKISLLLASNSRLKINLKFWDGLWNITTASPASEDSLINNTDLSLLASYRNVNFHPTRGIIVNSRQLPKITPPIVIMVITY